MSEWYYLDNDNMPYPAPNPLDDMEGFIEYNTWREGNRIVKQVRIDEYFVSTVYLGLDHSSWGKGHPVLWETMIFTGNYHDQYQARYTSLKDALAGHEYARCVTLLWQKRNNINIAFDAALIACGVVFSALLFGVIQ